MGLILQCRERRTHESNRIARHAGRRGRLRADAAGALAGGQGAARAVRDAARRGADVESHHRREGRVERRGKGHHGRPRPRARGERRSAGADRRLSGDPATDGRRCHEHLGRRGRRDRPGAPQLGGLRAGPFGRRRLPHHPRAAGLERAHHGRLRQAGHARRGGEERGAAHDPRAYIEERQGPSGGQRERSLRLHARRKGRGLRAEPLHPAHAGADAARIAPPRRRVLGPAARVRAAEEPARRRSIRRGLRRGREEIGRGAARDRQGRARRRGQGRAAGVSLRTRFPNLAGDLRGGLASAIVGLPYAVTAAMLAFAPLGPGYVGHGMLAGLVVIGGTPFQISGPRGSVSVLTASIVALALAHPALGDAGAAQGPRVLGVLLVCLMMAGAIQIAFGVLGMGNALRFLPYPVISGFMVGLGILVALPQIPALLGAPGSGDWWSAIHQLPAMRPGALLVGLVTIATLVHVRKHLTKWPAPVVAMLAGTSLHYALAPSALRVGPVPWDLVNGSFPLLPWEVPKVVVLDSRTFSVLVDLLPAKLTLAFVGSLETLLSSSVLAITSNTRYDSRRELIGQGISNIAIAVAGGVASAAAPFRGVTNYS